MSQKLFTRDRIFNLLSSILGTAVVFALPKITTVLITVTWIVIAIYGAFTLFGEYVLLEGSGRTGVYAAVIAIRQNKKKTWSLWANAGPRSSCGFCRRLDLEFTLAYWSGDRISLDYLCVSSEPISLRLAALG